MKYLRFQIVGLQPMLLHNGQLANPLNPFSKAIKAVTSKRKKSDEDFEEVSRLEFLGGLYYDDEIGVFIPAVNIDASIRDGAKILKRGKDIQRGSQVIGDKWKLGYEGPKKAEDLQRDQRFVDIRGVGVNTSRVQRTRPIFNSWHLSFVVSYDEGVFNADDYKSCVEVTGRLTGMCDGRPRWGKFQIEKVEDLTEEEAWRQAKKTMTNSLASSAIAAIQKPKKMRPKETEEADANGELATV